MGKKFLCSVVNQAKYNTVAVAVWQVLGHIPSKIYYLCSFSMNKSKRFCKLKEVYNMSIKLDFILIGLQVAQTIIAIVKFMM